MTRYWVGGTGNFSDTAHWSASSGGAGGASVPVAGDLIIYDTNSGGGTCTFDQAVAGLSYDQQAGNTTNVTTSATDYSLTLTGSIALSAATFTANGSTITVSGNVFIANTSNRFSRGTSSFVIDGTGNISNPQSSNMFNDLTLSGAITTTLTGNIDIDNIFATGTGTIQDDGSLRLIKIRDTMTNQGPTWTVSSALEIDWFGSSAQTIPTDDYGTVQFLIGASATVSLGGNVTCSTLTVSKFAALVILDMVTHDLTCTSVTIGSGTATNNGQLNCGSGTLTATSITIRDSDFGSTGRDNKILGESATIKHSSNFTIESVMDNGVFDAGTATVIATGSANQNITLAGNSFWNYKSENGASTVSFLDLVDIDNQLQADAASTDIDFVFPISLVHTIEEFVFTGSGSNAVTLVSDTPATQYDIALGKTSNCNHVDVTDCNLTGGVAHAFDENSVDGGGNTTSPPVGWQFNTILSKVVTRGAQRGILRGTA